MRYRWFVTLCAVVLATSGVGCGTVNNLHESPGVVYGGVRADFVTLANHAVGGPILWGAVLIPDVIGDTLTLPIVLVRQTLAYRKSVWPANPPARQPDPADEVNQRVMGPSGPASPSDAIR